MHLLLYLPLDLSNEHTVRLTQFSFFLFIYSLLAALRLCCCTRAFSSCGEGGLVSSGGAWASHLRDFSCCGAWALGSRASVVGAGGFSSCDTQSSLPCGTWSLPGLGTERLPRCIGRALLFYFFNHQFILIGE